jgi:hypothetical protein
LAERLLPSGAAAPEHKIRIKNFSVASFRKNERFAMNDYSA